MVKIVFDSKEEERKFLDKIKDKIGCPGRIKLQENCVEDDNDNNICFRCWQSALNSEISSLKEKLIHDKVRKFMNEHHISCAESVAQRDSVNLACVDFVAELVAIMLEE